MKAFRRNLELAAALVADLVDAPNDGHAYTFADAAAELRLHAGADLFESHDARQEIESFGDFVLDSAPAKCRIAGWYIDTAIWQIDARHRGARTRLRQIAETLREKGDCFQRRAS